MAKKCETCGGAVDGMFKKVCDKCRSEAYQQEVAEQLEMRQSEFKENLASVKKANPSLATAWEKMFDLTGAKWQPDIAKGEAYYSKMSDDLVRLVPSTETVLAVAKGISVTSSAIWVVTERSLVIEKRTILNDTFKGSEVVSLDNITGIESSVVNRATGAVEIKITRAANEDTLFGLVPALADTIVAALNKSKGAGKTSATNSNSSDPADAIRKLKGLLDDGLISQDEFDKKKADLIDKM